MTAWSATARCVIALAVAAGIGDPLITAIAVFLALRTLDRYHQEHT